MKTARKRESAKNTLSTLKNKFNSCLTAFYMIQEARNKLRQTQEEYNDALLAHFLALLRKNGKAYCSAGRHAAMIFGMRRQFFHKRTLNRLSNLADERGFVELKAIYTYCTDCQKKEEAKIQSQKLKEGEIYAAFAVKERGNRFFALMDNKWILLPDTIKEIGPLSCWVENQAEEVGIGLPSQLSFHNIDNPNLTYKQLEELAVKLKIFPS